MGEPSSYPNPAGDPDMEPSDGGFDAMYMDDDGNKFYVGTFATEEAARQARSRALFKSSGVVSLPSEWQPTAMERTFQEILTTDEVFSIIYDNSYDTELQKFSSSNPVELFRKKVTATDLQTSHGLRLGVEDAETHFGTKPLEAIEFLDWQKESWSFAYRVQPMKQRKNRCFLAGGWRAFANEKNLQKEDAIVFFRCEEKDLEGKVVPYLMLAVAKPVK